MEGHSKGIVPVLSTNYLVNTILEGRMNGERYCFMQGAGASFSSNLPSGAQLEYTWMEEMNESPGRAEVRSAANGLRESSGR